VEIRIAKRKFVSLVSILSLLYLYLQPIAVLAESSQNILVITESSDTVKQRTSTAFDDYEGLTVIGANSLLSVELKDITAIIVDGSYADTWEKPKFTDFIGNELKKNILLSFARTGGILVISISYMEQDPSQWEQNSFWMKSGKPHVWQEPFPYEFDLSMAEKNEPVKWMPYNAISKSYSEKLQKAVALPENFALRFSNIGEEWNIIGSTSEKTAIAIESTYGIGNILLLLENLSATSDSKSHESQKRSQSAISLVMEYVSGKYKRDNDIIYLTNDEKIEGIILKMDRTTLTIDTAINVNTYPRDSIEKIFLGKKPGSNKD